MDDWLKIAAGSAVGYISGILTEPVRIYFRKRAILKQMEFSIYSEMADNLNKLIRNIDYLSAPHLPSRLPRVTDWHMDRFLEAHRDRLFDQLKYKTGIFLTYHNLRKLEGLATEEELPIMETVLYDIRATINTNLNKALFTKFVDKDLVSRISKRPNNSFRQLAKRLKKVWRHYSS